MGLIGKSIDMCFVISWTLHCHLVGLSCGRAGAEPRLRLGFVMSFCLERHGSCMAIMLVFCREGSVLDNPPLLGCTPARLSPQR